MKKLTIYNGSPRRSGSNSSLILKQVKETLAHKLDRVHLGTAIKGGVEGLQTRSASAQGNVIGSIVNTLTTRVNKGHFDAAEISKLAIPVQFGSLTSALVRRFGVNS